MAIVNLHRSDVVTDITGGTEFSFSKEASSKLYQMMSNYLYSDKEYAVVSELAANAIDAHAMMGKETTPINIQLPTRLDSSFVVRDFGPGLSEGDVYRFLTSYGESSKGGSNDQIGFWGIGSKSPAAVSDSWSIISYHAGKKIHFEVFITESGVPTLKKIFETETDESGLEVIVPVDLTGHDRWISAAKKAFKYYAVKPTFNREVIFDKTEYSNRGDGWALHKSGVGHAGRLLVTMREYSIDYGKMYQVLQERNSLARDLFEHSFSRSFDLMFNIGEIDLSISREQIQYNEKTINAIVAKMEKVSTDFTEIVKSKLDKTTNHIEYRKVIYDFHSDGVPRQFLLNIVGGKYNIKNIPADVTELRVPVSSFEGMVAVFGTTSKHVKSNFNCWSSSAIRAYESYSYNTKETTREVSLRIETIDRVFIVVRDVNDAMARCKYLDLLQKNINDKNQKYIYLCVNENPFGADVPSILASSLAKAPREQVKRAKENMSEYYVLEGARFLKIQNKVLNDFRNKGTSFAVKIENAVTAVGNGALSKKANFLLKQGWTAIGYKGEAPVGIPLEVQAICKLHRQYKNDAQLQKEIETYDLRQMYNQVSKSSAAILACRMNREGFKVESKKWNDMCSTFKPVMDHFTSTGSFLNGGYIPNAISTWYTLCEYVDDPNNINSIVLSFNDLDERYPLLSLINPGWYRNDINFVAIKQYIELIDKNI